MWAIGEGGMGTVLVFVWARVGVCVGVVAKTIAVPGRVAGGSFLRGGV
jgi:hypothetical protein